MFKLAAITHEYSADANDPDSRDVVPAPSSVRTKCKACVQKDYMPDGKDRLVICAYRRILLVLVDARLSFLESNRIGAANVDELAVLAACAPHLR